MDCRITQNQVVELFNDAYEKVATIEKARGFNNTILLHQNLFKLEMLHLLCVKKGVWRTWFTSVLLENILIFPYSSKRLIQKDILQRLLQVKACWRQCEIVLNVDVVFVNIAPITSSEKELSFDKWYVYYYVQIEFESD